MFPVKHLGFYKLNFMNAIFRAASFKVLKTELNYDDPDFKVAKNASNNVKTVVDSISNLVMIGGGKKSIHRHTVINKKLLVRNRLKLLFDDGSPVLEIGLFAGMYMDYGTIPAAASVAAIGKINQQYCIVAANDATVKGGTLFPISLVKQLRVQELSYMNHMPTIYLVDSGGAYLPLQADIFADKNHGGRTFYNEAVLSSMGIPQIAMVCGSCTAGGAYCPTMAEEAIIVKNSGVIFLGGPPLVKAATGEIVTEQELGGADVHCRVSGCTDYYAENEEEAFEMCRESVSSLNIPEISQPSSFNEPLYSIKDLSLISGKQVLSKKDMYVILARILDGSMFKEFKQKFGEYLITGFGYIHGILVGILANCNPLSFQDAQKGSHFIQLCQKRTIPLIFLQNSGHVPDDVYNHNFIYDGVLKDRAKMVAAHACADVPKITINIGGCISDDNFTMCGFGLKPNFLFSWPLAHTLAERNLQEQLQIQEKELQYINQLSESKDGNDYEILFEDKTSAFYQASQMTSDGIILPECTRHVIALCLEVSSRKSTTTQYTQQKLSVLRM